VPDRLVADGDALLAYASKMLGLHDEALVSLAKSNLAGRVLLGLTEDATCSALSRILGRFRRLHLQVAVRTKVRMSLVLRSMLERGDLDVAIIQVFAHQVRPAGVVLFREDLHWAKSRELTLQDGSPLRSFPSMTNAFIGAGR
jgi:DNA-binding transcriptional LysR family regulator